MTVREFMQVTKINEDYSDELSPVEDVDIYIYRDGDKLIMTWDLEQYLDNQIERLEIMSGQCFQEGERPAPIISIYI